MATPTTKRLALVLTTLLLVGAAAVWVVQRLEPALSPTEMAGRKPRPAGPDLRAGVPAWAQDPDAEPGVVTGMVRAPDGAPVSGALVALFPDLSTGTGDVRIRPAATGRSGGDGRFRLAGVRPGEYGATATATGFAGAHAAGLVLLPGRTLADVELVLEAGGVTLTGRVLDRGGGSIAGAEVRLFAGLSGTKQTRIFQVLAGEGGHYQLQLPKGKYYAVADAEGYAAASRALDLAAIQTADFSLSPAARLAGRVIEKSSGAPVAAATVVLGRGDLWWLPPRESKTDGAGRFELRDLDGGVFRVLAQKGHLVAPPQEVEVAPTDRATEVEIALVAGQSIAGRVLLEGAEAQPLAGARLRLAESSFQIGRVRATSAEDGRYRIEGVLPGRFRLSAETGRHAPAVRELVLAAGKNATDVDLRLSAEAAVTGQVLGQDGRPAAGVTVTALVTESSAGLTSSGRMANDRSDGEGRFRLGALNAGKVRIEAQANERGRATFGPEELGAGETKDITLTLEEAAKVSGVVRWSDGTPAAGVSVMGMVPSSYAMVQAKTEPDGSYELSPLPKGDAILMASRAEGMAGLMQPAGPGSDKQRRMITLEGSEHLRGIDFELERADHKVSGLVLDPDGGPVAGASVGAEPEGRASGMRAMFGGLLGETPIVSDEEGRFVIPDLPAGPYRVWAKHPNFPDAVVQKVATDATGVRIRFPKEGVLAGRVVDGAGKPVADYRIGALEVAAAGEGEKAQMAKRLSKGVAAMLGGGGQMEIHDPAGAFELRRLTAGAYELVATTTEGQVGRLGRVEVRAGEHKKGLEVVVAKGLTLRGKVLDHATGKPAAGLMVVLMDDQPVMRTAGADGSFSFEGLLGGKKAMFSYGGPMTGYVPDWRLLTLPAKGTEHDLGTLRAVRGEMRLQGTMIEESLGFDLDWVDGKVVTKHVHSEGAAGRAGLKEGQRITAIGKQSTEGLGAGSVAHLLAGEPGTKVELTVEGPAQEPPQTLTLVHANPPTETATGPASASQNSQ